MNSARECNRGVPKLALPHQVKSLNNLVIKAYK